MDVFELCGCLYRYSRDYSEICEPGSSVVIMSGYGLDDRANEVRSPAEAGGFFL
jgi:hypothetical protein